eukprot:CAMPEP_0203676836 /NCGR_PEP_ID=MMETSP0090-20130426/25950_1 /ASSEMBLY_ACC=CAM_ASM_001088 /TAXON_ID=426623 /ORGANISM="Chaetoceros affinis, Strain CCMP159" /LENGTH=37 /DNA_ID= /DNA_START= /DNA_END= /DNA_ORIENTATION=
MKSSSYPTSTDSVAPPSVSPTNEPSAFSTISPTESPT